MAKERESPDRLVSITVDDSTHTRTATEWLRLARADLKKQTAEEKVRNKEKKQPLEVFLSGGVLTITLGIDTLAFAVQGAPDWPAEVKILDAEKFAKDVLRELDRESEDGSTMVHRLLDRAGVAAMEQGSEGITE